MRVLLVDDSGTMRTIIRRCLNGLGITEIVEAEDGVAGLQRLQGERFDVILSDWNMPRMNGLEFLQAARAAQVTVPFVMITTEAERGRVVQAIQSGVSDYMVKPFTPDALRDKLVKWVGCLV